MDDPSSALPTGTITFLFTDIEGSTELVERVAPGAYRAVLERHHTILRSACAAHGGVERGTQGDAFLVVFRAAPSAVAAAVEAQRALAAEPWPPDAVVRVRMGLHAGEGVPGGDDYVGSDINRAARVAAAAHGGQVLLSEAAMALTRRSLPQGVDFVDLGEHRLRGLVEPDRLYQLTIDGLPAEFPPIRTVHVEPAHLPPRMTSFVGRERELVELERLLAENRLVTLLGAGGTGKTSLAVELARGAADAFPDGVWFVPLDAISDPDLVGSSIVAALGLRDVTGRSARARLLDNLADRTLLLVLDNFEQVLAGAGIVGEVLAGAPTVKAIATSRAPLRLAAEQVFALGPLPVPGQSDEPRPDEVERVASVRLFLDRVRRAQPSFTLSALNVEPAIDICRRLDGLPLGIELAAARVPLLGVAGVRDRLAKRLALPGNANLDVPARQRTLQDTVAWSLDLLEPAAQSLFASLAVFVGGCRPEELEAVCGPEVQAGRDVLDDMAHLVDQSLVSVTEHEGAMRFEMLETIRGAAADRFAQAPDRAVVVRRHALTYLALAEACAPALPGRARALTLERIAVELGNLRASMRWAIDNGEAEIGLRLATALTRFWSLRGELEEGRSTIASALSIPGADAPSHARMRAIEAAGTLAYYSGRQDEAARDYQAQLDLARQLDDQLGVADALFNLPFTVDPHDWAEVTWMIDEAQGIYERLGEVGNVARLTWLRGATLAAAGRRGEALETWTEAYEASREADDLYYAALAASSLATTSLDAGDRDAAARWFITALGIARQVSDITGMTVALPVAAMVAIELVGLEPGAVIMGAYQNQSKRFGVKPPAGLGRVIEQGDPLGRLNAELDPERLEAALERGRAMTPDESTAFVLGLFDGIRPPSETPGASDR